MLKSVELFAGAGGLGLGTELSGFEAVAAIEWDKWACETLAENKRRGYPLVQNWDIHCGDVRDFDFERLPQGLDLVSGGPPCQPFSIGGKHRAYNDQRDMFSAFADAVASIRPRAFIVENVKGLTRSSFANYLQYVMHRLEMPEISPKEDETWQEHLRRLEQENTSTGDHGVTYKVTRELFNAADFGAPQKRERVFIVGFRSDQNVHWSFPETTHSVDQLLREQWVTGEYWDRHGISANSRGTPPARMKKRIEALRRSNETDGKSAWRTVRDALEGLPEPRKDGRNSPSVFNHKFQPGARTYVGHTGSPIDLPSKALKAGDHGVPGGENMLVKPNGEVRYFTVREAARLQTFPDGYVFHGAWSETMRQLGNAVPVALARAIASSVAEKLIEADFVDAEKSRAH